MRLLDLICPGGSGRVLRALICAFGCSYLANGASSVGGCTYVRLASALPVDKVANAEPTDGAVPLAAALFTTVFKPSAHIWKT